MSDLGKVLRLAQRNSYEIWFNRWFEHNDFPKTFEISAKKGYSAYVIDVTKLDDYLERRLSDDRVLKLLKKKLPGIKIERKQGSLTRRNLFNMKYTSKYNRIIFSWDDDDKNNI